MTTAANDTVNEPPPQSAIHWVGVDVCKDTLAVYDLSAGTYTSYRNDPDGIEALANGLLTRPNRAIVCEATGGYEAALALELNRRPRGVLEMKAANAHFDVRAGFTFPSPRGVLEMKVVITALSEADQLSGFRPLAGFWK